MPVLVLGATALIALIFALNPSLLSWSWWFGAKPPTSLQLSFAGGVLSLIAASTWRDARVRRRRRQRSLAASSDGAASAPDGWIDWCIDHTADTSPGAGHAGSTDGGGDGHGGGDGGSGGDGGGGGD